MPGNQREELLERLITQYGDSVLRMCFLYVKDYQLAEDIVQETFLQAYEKYDTLKDRSVEKTWVIRIAINRCKNHLRARWFKRVSTESLPELAVEDEIEKILEKSAISREIMKLPPKYKEVILLYYYQELTVREISLLLNQKETTILQRLKRAREQLKPHLQEVLS